MNRFEDYTEVDVRTSDFICLYRVLHGFTTTLFNNGFLNILDVFGGGRAQIGTEAAYSRPLLTLYLQKST